MTDIDCTSSLRFVDEFINGKKGPDGKVVKQPRIGKELACGVCISEATEDEDQSCSLEWTFRLRCRNWEGIKTFPAESL